MLRNGFFLLPCTVFSLLLHLVSKVVSCSVYTMKWPLGYKYLCTSKMYKLFDYLNLLDEANIFFFLSFLLLFNSPYVFDSLKIPCLTHFVCYVCRLAWVTTVTVAGPSLKLGAKPTTLSIFLAEGLDIVKHSVWIKSSYF